jgi:hypothetical protein
VGGVELSELVGEPAAGRVFGQAMPGIADARGSGQVRLDAIACYGAVLADELAAGAEPESIDAEIELCAPAHPARRRSFATARCLGASPAGELQASIIRPGRPDAA